MAGPLHRFPMWSRMRTKASASGSKSTLTKGPLWAYGRIEIISNGFGESVDGRGGLAFLLRRGVNSYSLSVPFNVS